MAKLSAVCVSLLMLLLTSGCRKTAVHEEPVRPVRAIKVGDAKAIGTREFPGRAKSKDEVDLSFRVSGPLVLLPVDVGSKVKKGDVIAAIDPADFQNALDSAQANLARSQADYLAMQRGARPEEIEQLKAALSKAEARYRQAQAEFERASQLLPSKAISKSEYDIDLARRDGAAAEVKKAQEDLRIGQSGAREEDRLAKEAEIKALQAAVSNARNQLEYCVLKAPFEGTVASRYVDNYQTVQAKQPVVRLLDMASIEVTVQIPENLISLVPLVKKTVCRFDAFPGKEFGGRVTKIGSEASQTTRTYPVTIQLDATKDVQILPGMAGSIRAVTETSGEATAAELIVPPDAVFATDTGQQSYVWVVGEGGEKVERRPVTTGKLSPAGIAISDGLKPGEWVVTAGVHSLRENQVVKLLTEGSP